MQRNTLLLIGRISFKRSIDLANKKWGKLKDAPYTELTDPPPYKPSPSYICSEQTICMSAT